MLRPKRLVAALATVATVGGLMGGLAAPAGAQQPEGEGTGIYGLVNALGLPLITLPPLPQVNLPPGGSTSVIGVPAAPVITAGVLNAASNVVGNGGVASSASVLNASIINGLLGLPDSVLAADAITSECFADAGGSTADADVVNANALAGTIVLPVGAPPNTVIPLPLIGSVTLNEQEQNAAGILVRSVHLNVNALGLATADIVIAESGCFPFGVEAFGAAATRGGAADATEATPNLTG